MDALAFDGWQPVTLSVTGSLRFSALLEADATADVLLARHHALMRSQSPAESCHVLTAEELRAQGACLFVGRDAKDAVKAIGAWVMLSAPDMPGGAAELKSMHCHSDLRGQGAGHALLTFMLKAARDAGITSFWLETGSAKAFRPARRLYAAHGFVTCPPFGSYREDPLSLFMTKTL